MSPNTDLFSKYASGEVPVTKGYFSNFLGLVTDCSLFHPGVLQNYSGKFLSDFPIPGDGVYGGAWEYYSLLASIDSAIKNGRKQFSIVELGAGWGPWVSAAGLVCKEMKCFDKVDLVAVEAHSLKCEALKAHLANNKITSSNDCKIRSIIFNGAAWDKTGTVFFPNTDIQDHGGGASEVGTEYRGKVNELVEVKSFNLYTVCRELDIIDFMHWDVQGAEARILESSIHLLQNRVRSIFIGTHSRRCEGEILDWFHKLGWSLVHELPCNFSYNKLIPTLEGMTTTDGELYFINSNFQ